MYSRQVLFDCNSRCISCNQLLTMVIHQFPLDKLRIDSSFGPGYFNLIMWKSVVVSEEGLLNTFMCA